MKNPMFQKRQAQPVKEQPVDSNQPKLIDIQGQLVPMFGQIKNKLAIVDLATLLRLTRLLPMASIREVINGMIINLEELRESGSADIASYIKLLQEEMLFHTTVNQIEEFIAGPVEEPIAEEENWTPLTREHIPSYSEERDIQAHSERLAREHNREHVDGHAGDGDDNN